MALLRTLKGLRRRLYGLRAFVPGLRRRHRLEIMVGPLGFWTALQAYQLQAVKALGLQPHHALLDLGCGPLQGGIAFMRYLEVGGYWGVDRSPAALAAGREEIRRLGLAAREPHLLLSSSFGDDELGAATFDFIWMSQILYYFDAAALHRLFALVERRLRPGGSLAGDILDPNTPPAGIWSPELQRHTPESLAAVAEPHGLAVASLGPIAGFGYPRRLGLRTNLLLRITRRPV